MKILIQRVKNASVETNNCVIGKINSGILTFIGVEKGDSHEQADKLAKKIVNLRIFPDEAGKMNRSLLDTRGEMLIVSQFTLCGDCKKGTRPSFDKSAQPDIALALYHCFVNQVKSYGIKTETGEFGAMMNVALVNDGPVTFWLEA